MGQTLNKRTVRLPAISAQSTISLNLYLNVYRIKADRFLMTISNYQINFLLQEINNIFFLYIATKFSIEKNNVLSPGSCWLHYLCIHYLTSIAVRSL